MNGFTYNIETDRLNIRPFIKEDYLNWLNQYNNRMPSQHKYDDGKIDMSICTMV
ncbi:hypothetical protein JOC95_003003 [Bacillus tianshenii]|uniref:Uncharacterized protein n=1 Tax=Sutcliffiella tianshenii TaxID=1463404 RepID=A0ABS2P2E4_9BACI|nr:hypothetical protein [Bacillus tianshenii]